MQIPTAVPAALAAPPERKPEGAEGAARQFEAVLVAQMLRAAREAGAGDDTASNSPVMDFAEQQMASVIANGGGLGIAALVARGLASADAQSK